MKVVILAGGLGTRLSEETDQIPKPMVRIGEWPILWHIMKIYSAHGLNDFVICAGYKGYVIKEFFKNYHIHTSDITFDLQDNSVKVHRRGAEPWTVTVIDTGADTQTGGRIKRIADYVDGTFCLTYGDGVANVNISDLVARHQSHDKLATVTAVQPPGRFGAIDIGSNSDYNDHVCSFQEKPVGDGTWINGGFFVLEPGVFDYIHDDSTYWEREPLQKLTREGQLVAYKHTGFWAAMDTLREKHELEALWLTGKAPWIA